MTQVNVLGRDVNVAFNMGTLIGYEQICDKPYRVEDLERAENRMALYYAALLSGDRECGLELGDLLEKAGSDDIRRLDEAVCKEMAVFYRMPSKAVVGSEEYGQDEEDLPKNV